MKERDRSKHNRKKNPTKMTFQPDYGAFVWKPALKLLFLLLCLILAGAFILFITAPNVAVSWTGVMGLSLLLVPPAGAGIYWYWRHNRFGKTVYTVTGDKIRLQSGSPISEEDMEILWNKVVQVHMSEGIIQRFFYQTGNIQVDAAGLSGMNMVFEELKNSENVFRIVLEHLNEPISLMEDEQTDEFRQHSSGILIDCLLGHGLIRFPFQLNTTYRIYKHYVVRSVHFLYRVQNVVPLSRLSDVRIEQSLPKRIPDLTNLTLSVPGMGADVLLENMKQSESIRRFLQERSEQLKGISHKDSRTESARKKIAPDFKTLLVKKLFKEWIMGVLALFAAAAYVEMSGIFLIAGFTTILILGGILLPIFPYIRHRINHFAVEGDRVEAIYSFLKRSVTSLSTDKIKGIVKHQDIIHQLMGSFTLEFHSIGSEKDVRFFSVKDHPDSRHLLQNILQNKGVFPDGEPDSQVVPRVTNIGLYIQHFVQLSLLLIISLLLSGASIYGFWHLARSGTLSMASSFLGGFLSICLSLGLLIGYYWYLNFFYKNHVSLDLHDSFLVFRSGYFRQSIYYIAYRDIRNVEYTKQPFNKDGWFVIDYAASASSEKNNQEYKNRTITFRLLSDVEVTAPALEQVFSGELASGELAKQRKKPPTHLQQSKQTQRKTGKEDGRMETRPAPNPCMITGIISGIIFPSMLALFILPDLGFQLNRSFLYILGGIAVTGGLIGGIAGRIASSLFTYSIESNQVTSSFRLLFKRTKSIKFQNIDNIETNRGMFDKLFDTGSIQISTTGGNNVEMNIRYIPDHTAFYERLQKEYDQFKTVED